MNVKIRTIIIIIILVIPCYAQTPHSTAYDYLQLWQTGEYSAMYDILSDQSKIYISRGEFIDEHQDFARQNIIEGFAILEVINYGQTATIYYRLDLFSTENGSKSINKKIILVIENIQWKIDF